MGSEFSTLDEMCELIVDCPHSTPEWMDSGVIVLRNQNIRGGRLDLSSPSYTNEAGYAARTKRAIPQVGDIVFTREAPMGEVCLIPQGLKCCLGQRQVLLRPKTEINGRYLYWALQSPSVQSQIAWNEGTGTTVSNVRIPVLKALEIPRQGINETKIAEILTSLSDKVTVNQQINQTLEQMAQTIFKSWFVDFEPVRAKIAALEAGGSQEDATLAAMQAISGKDQAQLTQLQAESPEQYNELHTTAELFPSAMQDSELGEIPEGWEWSTVGCEFDITMGQSPPGHTYNEKGIGSPFFQGRRDFGSRFPSNRVFCSEPKRLAKAGDTLLSVRAPVGDINMAVSDCCIGRGLASLKHNSGCSSYTYYAVLELGAQLKSFDTEGTVFGSINQKSLKDLVTLKPSDGLLQDFRKKVRDLDALISNNHESNIVLKSLRESLLPKLLSGEIEIVSSEQELENCS